MVLINALFGGISARGILFMDFEILLKKWNVIS